MTNQQQTTMKTKLMMILSGLIALVVTGCRPYDTPTFVDVPNDGTAFVIDINETNKQAKLDSTKLLNEKKVSAKRIQISHYWIQTGRWYTDGHWADSQRVYIVRRSPTTVQWFDDPNTKTDRPIWIESSDSIGFSIGFTVTAEIKEEDTAEFLYQYSYASAKSDADTFKEIASSDRNLGLDAVLEREVRSRIQTTASEFSAKHKMDSLREKKNELVDYIRKDAIPYFKERGVTINNIGIFGGFSYENEAIQNSIDNVFVKQQEKLVALADKEAQLERNQAMELKARGEAKAAELRAEGESKAILTVADANARAKQMAVDTEIKSLNAMNEATEKSKNNAALMHLKELEVRKIQAERWDGKLPVWTWGEKANGNMLLNVDKEMLPKQ